MTRVRVLLWLDVLLLFAFLCLQVPRATGLPGHEWSGLAFGLVVLLHLLLNWRWIVNTLRRVREPGAIRSRANATLNGLLFVMMVVTVFSGLVVSEVVLPTLGVTGSTLAAWRHVHNSFSRFVIVALGLHIALNWDWIAGVVLRRARGSSVAVESQLDAG
jgi:Domain of unknown function (DUF4405)